MSILQITVILGLLLFGSASDSPTTVVPTSSPTSKPTAKPTTSIPTTHAPSQAPTNSSGATLPPSRRQFLSDFDYNLSIDGKDTKNAYYAMMYLALIVGPAFFICYMIYRVMYPRELISQIRLRVLFFTLLFAGWWTWPLAGIVMLFAPQSYEALIVELTITVIGLLLSIFGIVIILVPMRSSLDKLGQHSKFLCVACDSVQEMLAELGLEIKPKYRQEGELIYGSFSVPSIKSGYNDPVEAKDFTAVGANKDQVTENLYAQVASHWENVPAFKKIRNERLRDGETTMVAGSFSTIGQKLRVSIADERIKKTCGHEVSMCIRQGLISINPSVEDEYTCGDTAKVAKCSFTLVAGISDVARAVSSGIVTPNIAYKNPGVASHGRLFHCGNMRDAFPYLMNGYKAAEHSEM